MKSHKGSGIICVLLTTGAVLAIMGLVIRYTSYGIDIAHQRGLHEQHYFALKGLLNYGIAHALQLPKSDMQQSISLVVPADAWLSPYSGKVNIAQEAGGVKVHASLCVAPDKWIDDYYSLLI